MKTVLIVDDSFFMRIMLKNMLTNNGYTVVAEASNGDEAIEKYNEHLPDLLILDITIPELNGLEAAKVILEKHKNAKVIITNELNQQKEIILLLKYGIQAYILKPINSENLLSAISKIK